MTQKASDLKGGMWVTGARVLAQLAQFAIFIVAAQVLDPADFGVFALVAAVVVFLNQIATAGWSEYILHWQGDVVRLRQTLSVALAVGAAVAVIGILMSFPMAGFFEHPDAGRLTRTLAVAVFFGSGGATYAGILIWQNRLSASASCGLLGEIVNLAVAVPALWAGHGIMALAYGRLAGSIATCLSAGGVARVAPMLAGGSMVVRQIFAFSSNITLTKLLVSLRTYGGTLIIGGFLGPAAVGYYRAAQRIIGAFEEIVSEPVRVLAWSFFRKVPKTDGEVTSMARASEAFFPILLYASVPLFVGIAVMAEDLTLGILGEQWLAAVPVMQVLALAALVRAPGTASLPILSLVGKVALLPRYTLLYAVISVFCITIGAMNGLVATAVSEVIASLIVFAISARIMWHHAKIEWLRILRLSWPVVPACLAALSLPMIVQSQDLLAGIYPLLRFIGVGLAMVTIYLPVLFLFDRSLWPRLAAARGA